MLYFLILLISPMLIYLIYEAHQKKYRQADSSDFPAVETITAEEKRRTETMDYLCGILSGDQEYRFEDVEMFWETRDSDVEKMMERILEKYDMERALKFLELRVEIIDRAISDEVSRLRKNEKHAAEVAQIEQNLKSKTPLRGISADEIIIESESRELACQAPGGMHPVVYGFITGEERVREYCCKVIPYIGVPEAKDLLIGCFLNNREDIGIRYDSITALLKMKTDRESAFRLLCNYSMDERTDTGSKALAVKVMGQIAENEVKKHLLDVLSQSPIELKIAAALALGNFDDEEVIRSLIREAGSENVAELTDAVADSLKKMDPDVIDEEISRQFEKLDDGIRKVAMRITAKLSLRNMIPYVRKMLQNPDLDIRIMAGDFLLDQESVSDLDLLLDYFKEIDGYILGKSMEVKPAKSLMDKGIRHNEKRSFYYVNRMDSKTDEEDLILNAQLAFQSSSKFVKATCILKLSDSADSRAVELLVRALEDTDPYLEEAAINAIAKRKNEDLDGLLADKFESVSDKCLVPLLNAVIAKKIYVDPSKLERMSKVKDQFARVLIATLKRNNGKWKKQ